MKTTEYSIGEKIREAREAHKPKKMSGKALGEKLGVSAQQISKYENGKDLSVEKLLSIAKVFDKPITWFLSDEDTSSTHPQACKTFADAIGYILALEDAFRDRCEAREKGVSEGGYSPEYDREIPPEVCYQLVYEIPRELYLVLDTLAKLKELWNDGSLDYDKYVTIRDSVIENKGKPLLENYYADEFIGELPF